MGKKRGHETTSKMFLELFLLGIGFAVLAKQASKHQAVLLSTSNQITNDGSLTIDGYFGKRTIAALQTLLRQQGASLAVDGKFGPRTTAGLQAYLRRAGYAAGPVDGSCGRRTIRALQRWLTDLGASPGPLDGLWGYRTTRAMQAALNALLPAESAAAASVPVAVATPVVATLV